MKNKKKDKDNVKFDYGLIIKLCLVLVIIFVVVIKANQGTNENKGSFFTYQSNDFNDEFLYYKTNYLTLDNYASLEASEKYYQNLNVTFVGKITKILSNNNHKYEILIDNTLMEDEKEVVLNIKTLTELKEDNFVLVYGKFQEFKEVKVAEETKKLPYILGDEIYVGDTSGKFAVYNKDRLEKISDMIFNKKTTVSDITDEGASVNVNTSNDEFKNLELSTEEGSITKEDGNNKITLYPSLNNKNYIAIKYNSVSNKLIISYYNKNFKEKWSLDYKCYQEPVYDFSSTYLYIMVDDDLYVINLKEGKEEVKKTIGEKLAIYNVDNKIMAISKIASSAITIYDKDLKTLATVASNLGISKVDSIILSDTDEIILNVYYQGYENSELLGIAKGNTKFLDTKDVSNYVPTEKPVEKKTEYSNIKEINYASFYEKINAKEDFIIILTGKTCSHCRAYKPVLNEVLKKYKLNVYELEVWGLTDMERLQVDKYFSNFRGVPTTAFIKNGEENVDGRLVGEVADEDIVNALQANGFIK